MLFKPTVSAELSERFIFNFRMPVDALMKYVAVTWLAPQMVNGYGIASYCLLDLHHITAAPLPGMFRLHSISSGPRYSVIDTRNGTPAVFLNERQTSNAFGSWFTYQGFAAPHPYAPSSVTHVGEAIRIKVKREETGFRFTANARPCDKPTSHVFENTEVFGQFIARGTASYGVSRYEDRYTRIDLQKTEGAYEPLEVSELDSPIIDQWLADGGVFDSAFRTSGGRYAWTYYGLERGNAA